MKVSIKVGLTKLAFEIALPAVLLCAATAEAFGQPSGYTVIAGGYRSATYSAARPSGPSILEIPDASGSSTPIPSPQMSQGKTVEVAPTRPMTETEQHVRVVGPKFFPDPEEAIDLRGPARTPDQ